MIRKFYAETSAGQVHGRFLEGGSDKPPLVCLPPAPTTSLYYATIMPMLANDRDVISLDYPGYGGSDRMDGEPRMEQYAQIVFEALDSVDRPGPFDLLGLHSGCLVALEMALSVPDWIRRIVMVDVLSDLNVNVKRVKF